MGLAYLLLLLGSAAAFPDWKMERSDSNCKSTFLLPDTLSDGQIEDCLLKPDIEQVADGFEGTEDDKKFEIKLQCDAKRIDLFTGGALDPEKVKSFFEETVKGRAYEVSVKQGLLDCISILQQPYQLLAYMRCVADYC